MRGLVSSRIIATNRTIGAKQFCQFPHRKCAVLQATLVASAT